MNEKDGQVDNLSYILAGAQSMIGDLPMSELAPLDYRYALDAAMPFLSSGGIPMVRCCVPQLAAEVRQRIPRWRESGPATAGLWVEPLQDSWKADLATFQAGLQPGSLLVVVASRPAARLLPERRDWAGQPLGLRPAGLAPLLRALRRAGFTVEAQYSVHSLAAMGLNMLGQLASRLGRPDLGDRLHFNARRHYCSSSYRGGFSTIALLIAWRKLVEPLSPQRADAESRVVSSNDAGAHRAAESTGPPIQSTTSAPPLSTISQAVARIDAWLETMRCPGGYGGPVAHWWQQSLLYTGPGLDWRYEGIIAGYLQLWERTGGERWLAKARRAGDDLVAGQLPNGHFAASAFEGNLATAGTPHEAACDVGLLLLARALRGAGSSDWECYATCAERNLQAFYLGKLWDPQTQSISDSPVVPTFVPNKAATACEALFLMAEISGADRFVERYALPTLDRIIAHQEKAKGRLDGAIAQNTFRGHKIEKYFPLYMARCIPALLRGHHWTNDEFYLDSAQRAMSFIVRHAYEDGSLPTVVYGNQRANRYPSWIAPLADVLRAAEMLRPYGFEVDLSASLARVLAGQDESGGIQTARGFATQAGGLPSEVPDVRDVLHVVGWCDKVFRYLSSHVEPNLPVGRCTWFEIECTFQRQALRLVETPTVLEITSRSGVCYRWRKGEPWPEIATEEFWLR